MLVGVPLCGSSQCGCVLSTPFGSGLSVSGSGTAASPWSISKLSVTGTYTPTLSNMAVGTGGLNTATYRFEGDADAGLIHIEGQIIFGTAGQTFPGGSSELISMPTGFEITDTSGEQKIGDVTYFAGGSIFSGILVRSTATQLALLVGAADSTYQYLANLTNTAPFGSAWTSNNQITWKVACLVDRV